MDTHVSANGRIVIPAAVRRKLGLIEGTRIQFDVDEDARTIILIPITRAYIHNLRGKYRGKGLLKTLMAEKTREKRP